MDRAFPALGLLLGTLASALIAAGVARDLERAESRTPPTPDRTARVTPSSSTTPVVIRSVSLSRFKPTLGTSVVAPAHRALPVDWNYWTKQLVAVPRITPPLALKLKSKPAIVDYRKLPALLSRSNAGDTSHVDALIRQNDGINDDRETNGVPYGTIRVGGRAVKMQYRATFDGIQGNWTGALHYGADRRQTLLPTNPAATLSRHRAPSLPGDKPLLWSDDCRELIGWTSGAAATLVDRLTVGITQINGLLTLTDWTHRQFDAGLTRVAGHMKRQVWLATLPRIPGIPPVQSAQRPRGGKG